ncbi:MAG: hypothetical protein C4523_09520 [Myxococcales bacterium]|nr:MAG: hypothetical protein C4523_09520 [Myxococcales bacterium]
MQILKSRWFPWLLAALLCVAAYGVWTHRDASEAALRAEKAAIAERYATQERERARERAALEEQGRALDFEREQFEAAWEARQREFADQAQSWRTDRAALKGALARMARVEESRIETTAETVTMPAEAAANLAVDRARCSEKLAHCEKDCDLRLRDAANASALRLNAEEMKRTGLLRDLDTYQAEAAYWEARAREAKADELRTGLTWGAVGFAVGAIAAGATAAGLALR